MDLLLQGGGRDGSTTPQKDGKEGQGLYRSIFIFTNTLNTSLTQHLKRQSKPAALQGEAQALDLPSMILPAPVAALAPRGMCIKGCNLTSALKNRVVVHQSHDSWVLPNDILFFLARSTVMDLPALLLYKDFLFK